MTVSPHKRCIAPSSVKWNRNRQVLMRLLMGFGLVFGTANGLFAWQETEETETQEVLTPVQPEQSQRKEGQQKSEKTDPRFFLGPRPVLKRQVGPPLGAPRAILPQPYMPPGTIQVPPAPTDEAAETLSGTEVPEPENREMTISEDADVGAPPTGVVDETIQEGMLETLDPSGVALLRDEKGYPRDFWADYDRRRIVENLTIFAQPTTSVAMSAVARKVALSGFALTPPETNTEIDAFISARLKVLAAHGDREGYLALLAGLAPDHDWSGLARDITGGHLLAGRIEDACAVAATERSDSNDASWLRLATFCRAVQGDRTGVDFHLGILEEAGRIQPTFYQLVDQILVEAEQTSGLIPSSGMVLSDMLQIDILEATMARLAKVQVPLLDMTGADPLAAKAMLGIPGVAPAAKLRLISAGLQQGWLGPDMLLDYLRAAMPAEDAAYDHQALISEDNSFDADVMLMKLAMHAADETVRADAIEALRQRATNPDKAFYILPALDLILGQQGGDPATAARQLRLALLANDKKAAFARFSALRAARAGDDLDTDAVLRQSWPLMLAVGMPGAPAATPDRLRAWWARQAEGEDRFGKAALLFTMLEALGHTVPEEAWGWAEAGSVTADGPGISAALWRRLLVMKAEGNRAGALALGYRMTAGRTVSAAFAGSLVGALRELGLHEEANGLAVEILVRRGL